MSVGGQVVEVRVEPRGSELTADAASSATSITVSDPTPFDTDGGRILLNGSVYTYTALVEVDDAAEAGMTNATLTLSSGLVGAATATTPVDLWSGAQVLDDVVLTVDVGPDEPPVDVRVNTTQRKDWTALEGALEPPVAVTLSDDLTTVLDADGYTPTIDGSMIDPTTLPDQVPTASPDTVLTVQATGDASGITAVATPDGTMSGTTLIKWAIDGVVAETTQSLVYRFTKDSTGATLADTVSYSITAQPTNSVGDGATSAAAVGQLNSGVSSKTVLAWVATGFLLAGTIQVGQMTLSPPTTDSPGGLDIPLTNGGRILLPADGSDAIITAVLRARSLVVENNLRILGTLNAVVGGLQLANGTSAPAIKPRAGTSWTHSAAYTTTDTNPSSGYWAGLYSDSGKWVTTLSLFGGYIVEIDKTTGVSNFLPAFGAIPSNFNPVGGITKVGTSWYVLGSDGNRSGDWYVYIYNSSYVKTGEFLFAGFGNLARNPQITTDGTDLLIAYQTSSVANLLRLRAVSTSGVLGVYYNLDSSWNADVTGVYVGSADFGSSRIIVAHTGAVRAYTNTAGVSGTTQTRVTSHEWVRAAGDTIRGLSWDGTRFHTFGGSAKVWHYSTLVTATSRSITHTWFDNDALGTGTHETEASPALTYSQAPRQWLQVDTDPPSFAGFPDDPNAVRIYIANQRQADLATGQTTVVYDLPATGGSAAPTSNGFAAVSAPGSLASGATDGLGALTSFLGSGDSRVGWLRTDATGKGKDNVGLRAASGTPSIADSTFTLLAVAGTADHDGGAFSVASSVITINVDGLYNITASARWATNATGRRLLVVESFTGATAVGSGTQLDADERGSTATVIPATKVHTDVWLTAGTKVRAYVYQTSGGALNLRNDAAPAQLNVRRVG